MLYISENGSIRLTRGDTARLNVSIKNDLDEEDYELDSGDILEFSIKKSVRDEEALVHKVLTGTSIFHIEPSDTRQLSFGKYLYDVQLTKTNGDVYTIIEPTAFEIMSEVTY